MADANGIEPLFAVLETAVLPLDQAPIAGGDRGRTCSARTSMCLRPIVILENVQIRTKSKIASLSYWHMSS